MTPPQSPVAGIGVDGVLHTEENLETYSDNEDISVGEWGATTQNETFPGTSAQDDTQEDLSICQDQSHEGENTAIRNRDVKPHQIRDIVRLFQCRKCSRPLQDAVTLPCGRSLCKECIPETHLRTRITYPAVADRLQRLICPFEECAKEHCLSDCAFDVVLNRVCQLIGEEIHRSQAVAAELNISTSIGIRDPWDTAGLSSMKVDDTGPKVIRGRRLAATWSLAALGGFAADAELNYTDIPPVDLQGGWSDLDTQALRLLQSVTRAEVDCQVCYGLLHDPFTTGCGHTFCRSCLHRTLDHSDQCPMCRRPLAITPFLDDESCPSNYCINRLMDLFWPDEKAARKETVASDVAAQLHGLDLPLFVCTLSFPSMPTFLHIFEPRYRLMIRRALEGNSTFGMVLPKRPRGLNDASFHKLGTLLRILHAEFYPDGRILIETTGLTRFKVLRSGEFDGYVVAKTERVDDVSLQEEEAAEAAEVAAAPRRSSDVTVDSRSVASDAGDDNPVTEEDTAGDGAATEPPVRRRVADQRVPRVPSDLQSMSTQSLMDYAVAFVSRMREESVPWLTTRMLDMYGQCPQDPAIFPWWLASTLPVKDLEKYRLLGTSSVRARLKICCGWILEWETSRWSIRNCTII